MDHWPPHTVLVHLDEPIHYFDRETGHKQRTIFIAVTSRHPDVHAADHARIDVFPCDAEGGFIEDHLVPIRKLEFQRITHVLEGLGFDVVDENNTLMMMPGG
jgi:hypothetical protein